MNDRVVLTKDQARNMLANGDPVHTFTQRFVGADWDRAMLLEAIEHYEFELTGPVATGMGYGMCFQSEPGLWIMVCTKPEVQA